MRKRSCRWEKCSKWARADVCPGQSCCVEIETEDSPLGEVLHMLEEWATLAGLQSLLPAERPLVHPRMSEGARFSMSPGRVTKERPSCERQHTLYIRLTAAKHSSPRDGKAQIDTKGARCEN